MPTSIILNADDFGLDRDTAGETISLLESNILSSASIMPSATCTNDAIAYARSSSNASFGIHLTFAEDLGHAYPKIFSLSQLSETCGLIREDGSFRPVNEVRASALLQKLDVAAIKCEMKAQIGLVVDSGVSVSHVDSHHHLHRHRQFRQALEEVLPAFGIQSVRNPRRIYIGRSWTRPSHWLGPIWSRPIEHRFRTPDRCLMIADTGNSEQLDDAIRSIFKHEVVEVACHPGQADPVRRLEVDQIKQLREKLAAAGAKFINWHHVSTN